LCSTPKQSTESHLAVEIPRTIVIMAQRAVSSSQM
jgi:hypothetical protein